MKPGENIFVKKPHLKLPYTDEQLSELIKCADPITGPLYFISNYVYIQHPTQGNMLFKPYDYQKRLIESFNLNRRVCVLAPRQCGKSISAAAFLLWFSMFNPDSTILITSNRFSGSREILTRIRHAYELVPNHIRCGVIDFNKMSISFDNGSRIESETTTENSGRGKSLSILYCDELAFVRNSIARDFWASVSLTLSTGGKILVTSTPNSSEDQFAEIWRQSNQTIDEFGNSTELGVNGFKAFRAYWDEHPDRGHEWLEEQRQSLGEERLHREVMCDFVIFEETLINPFKLNELKGVEPTTTEGQVRWYQELDPNKFYAVALDPSIGTGGDPAAIQVVSLPDQKQVAEWTHNKTPIEKQVQLLAAITKKLDDATGNKNQVYYTVENNTIGEAALVAIRNFGEDNIQGIFLSEPSKMGSGRKARKGLNTSNTSKLAACSQLKHFIEQDKLTIYSKALVSELKTFIASENSYKAKIGEHDDLVMAMLCIVRMIAIMKNYLPNLDEDELEDDQLPMPFFAVSY